MSLAWTCVSPKLMLLSLHQGARRFSALWNLQASLPTTFITCKTVVSCWIVLCRLLSCLSQRWFVFPLQQRIWEKQYNSTFILAIARTPPCVCLWEVPAAKCYTGLMPVEVAFLVKDQRATTSHITLEATGVATCSSYSTAEYISFLTLHNSMLRACNKRQQANLWGTPLRPRIECSQLHVGLRRQHTRCNIALYASLIYAFKKALDMLQQVGSLFWSMPERPAKRSPPCSAVFKILAAAKITCQLIRKCISPAC